MCQSVAVPSPKGRGLVSYDRNPARIAHEFCFFGFGCAELGTWSASGTKDQCHHWSFCLTRLGLCSMNIVPSCVIVYTGGLTGSARIERPLDSPNVELPMQCRRPGRTLGLALVLLGLFFFI